MNLNFLRPAIFIAIAIPIIGSCRPARADTTLAGYYQGEVMHNVSGGLATGSVYMSDAGFIVNSTFESLLDGSDASVRAFFLWNNRSTFSGRYVGDFQVVSNIEAPEALRVYELWYEQSIRELFSVRVGLYDLNSEFDVIDTATLFVNSSQGIGAEYAQSGRAGPSIFPLTSLAARFEFALGTGGNLRYAVLDGVPGDPEHPGRTVIDLGGDDGVLHALEYDHQTESGTRFVLGGWLYSADFDLLEPGVQRARDDGNGGIYASVDAAVYESDTGATVSAFLRYGVADEDFNPLDSYIGAGVALEGFLPGRPDDTLGFAIARGEFGGPYRRSADGRIGAAETVLELTWDMQITDWLRLQPDIQYVISPGGDAAIDDALVLGLRFEVRSSLAIPHGRRD